MAASGFGVCGSVRPKLTTLWPSHGWKISGTVRFDGVVVARRSNKPLIVSRSSVSVANHVKVEPVDDHSKDTFLCDAVTRHIPNAVEVESLLTVLCDTTSIAEVELKLGEFRLYVLRNLAEKSAPAHLPAPAAVVTQPAVDTANSNGLVASTSLALSKPTPSSGGVQTLLDKAEEKGLVILKSPRVGYFRRSRTIKGKRTPPPCKEKDIVKEGQVLCYIEQLGGEIPVESDISGEVVQILRPDGDPVGYGDALIAVLPSFPGIKNIH